MVNKNGKWNKINRKPSDSFKALGYFIKLMLNNMDYADAFGYVLLLVGLSLLGFGMILGLSLLLQWILEFLIDMIEQI